ncbi:MAG: WhiB family transcriptional regulator [Acidimicrobiia bacterium]
MAVADPLGELGRLVWPTWHDRAACRDEDPALFFPPRGVSGAALAEAKAVCARCPVRGECLADALATGSSSASGAERERRRGRWASTSAWTPGW